MEVPHHALTIPEITLQIFYAVGYPISYSSRGTLASLAVSCKLFSSLALDILWKEMDSFLPVFKTIPTLHISNGRYILKQTSPYQLTRFDEYARRIRKFYLDLTPPDIPIDRSMYTRVTQLKNSAPLFPSLRSLEWTGESVASEPGDIKVDWMLFLSPSLRSVALYDIHDDLPIAEAFIHALADEAPSLESFKMDSVDLKLTASIACQFTPHLRSLLILHNGPIFHANTFTALNSLRDLTSLDIDLHDPPAVPHSSNRATSSHSVYLPSLVDLRLIGLSLNVCSFLDNLTAPSLISIFLTNNTGREPIEQRRWRNCFEQIARRFHSSLRKIRLYLSVDLTEALKSFLPLHNLEHVDLPITDVGYSDMDVGNIASAWPALKWLRLPWVAQSSLSGRPSIAALPSLANCCPSLAYLELCIMDTALPDLESAPILSHGLRTLNLHGPVIGDPMATARYLNRLFPSLNSVTYALGNGDHWKEVVDSLHVVQI